MPREDPDQIPRLRQSPPPDTWQIPACAEDLRSAGIGNSAAFLAMARLAREVVRYVFFI